MLMEINLDSFSGKPLNEEEMIIFEYFYQRGVNISFEIEKTCLDDNHTPLADNQKKLAIAAFKVGLEREGIKVKGDYAIFSTSK